MKKKTPKATPVTVTLKRAALLPSQLDGVVTGGGKGETHTNTPNNLSHRTSST